jgi:uncharacterized membrane protein YeiB
VGFLTGWLTDGKFLPSFATMFGLGTALIADKQWAAGRSPRRLRPVVGRGDPGGAAGARSRFHRVLLLICPLWLRGFDVGPVE